jgi:hypothetical protein
MFWAIVGPENRVVDLMPIATLCSEVYQQLELAFYEKVTGTIAEYIHLYFVV